MDATTLQADSPLPNDVPTLQAMVRQLLGELARLRQENATLRDSAEAARKHRFGRRSERRRQRAAGNDDRPPPRRHAHGRATLPEHLERRDVVHDLSEEDKLCPCCGRRRVCIGEQTAEQLEMEPVHFYVLRTHKKSYACPYCDPATVAAEQRLQTAGPEQVGPLAKGLCGPSLLAHIICAKFADHLPLHRLAGQLARSGVELARSTLGDWMARAAALAEPLLGLMHRRALYSRVLHGDDTTVKLRLAGAESTRRAHLWVVIGDADYPYVLFDFTPDYKGEGPQGFLKGYRGYLQADALAQYERLYAEDQVQHCCCWAHARRKFVVAAEGGDERAEAALDWIAQLYAIERELPALLGPGEGSAEQRRQREEQRRLWRQQRAVVVLGPLQAWLFEQKAQVLPKSALGQAVGYALNHWEALGRYLEQGYLSIDNNLSERTLRAIAVGRNNWGVIGSARGGRTAAVLYSLVGTCKHLGIDPFGYLREGLPGLFALGESPGEEELMAWLPDRWLLGRARASPCPLSSAG